MKLLSPASARPWLPSLLAASALSAAAAPSLQVSGPSGTGITMKPRIVSWGGGAREDPAVSGGLESINSIFAGSGYSGAILGDGTAKIWDVSWPILEEVPAGLAPAKGLAFLSYHKGGLRTDGTVMVWAPPEGSNLFPPAGLAGVTRLAAGDSHFVALKDDGTVVTWGSNTYGQASLPVGLAGVKAIAAGATHSLAVKYDGTVVAWGGNQSGQSSVPAGLSGVAAVAAGTGHSLARKTNGTVVGWGGTPNSNLTPPAGLAFVTSIVAGNHYSAALTTNGNVTVWGSDSSSSGVLVPPPELGRVSKIAGGNSHITAVTTRPEDLFGPVGWNVGATRTYTLHNGGTDPLSLSTISKSGTFPGDFTITPPVSSVLAPGQSTEFSISFMPGGNGFRSAVIQIPSDDPEHPVFEFSVRGTGANLPPVAYPHGDVVVAEDGSVEIELEAADPNGDPLTYSFFHSQGVISIQPLGGKRFRVVPVKNFRGNTSFTFCVRDKFSEQSNVITVNVAVTSVNDLPVVTVPWEPVVVRQTSVSGANVPFMVGASDLEDGVLVPVITAGGQAVSSGSLFPTGDTTVEVAATDSNGASTSASFVVRVLDSPRLRLEEGGAELRQRQLLTVWGRHGSSAVAVPAGLSEVIGIVAGDASSFALRPDGTVAAWGENTHGITTVPSDLADVKGIAVGKWHAVAVRGDGTVVAWGYNEFGQTNVPVGLTDVIAVAAGEFHTLALRSDGTVAAWGRNDSDQATVPSSLGNIVAIAAGHWYSLALRADGRVFAWGSNTVGQTDVPEDLAGVVAIAAGNAHNLALLADGSVRGWGWNSHGEIALPVGTTPLRAISARSQSSMGLKADYTFKIWGDNNDTYYPPAGLSDLRQISMGGQHAMVTRAAPALSSFGTVVAYAPQTKVLTIRNTGLSTLNLAGFAKAGGQSGDFTIDSSESDSELLPGENTTLSVSFQPLAPGLRETTLKISSNDVEQPVLDVVLSGTWQNSAPVATNVGPLALAEDAAPLEITLPATDINGNAISFSIVTSPVAAAGSLGPVVGNKVSFTPSPNYNGTASFTFKANDGFADSNVATVQLQITPVNDPPVLKLPGSPVLVHTLGTTGLPDFLLEGSDLEDGWLTVFLTRDGAPVTSETAFPIGDTVVEATVTDKNGGTVTGSFVVRVVAGPDMVVEPEAAAPLTRLSGVTAWGANNYQQLDVPLGLENVTKLTAGPFHSLALKADGTVVAWGRNQEGQTNVPAGLANVKDIGAGWTYSCALKSDGTLEPWITALNSGIVPPAGLQPVASIGCGDGFIVGQHFDGTLSAWGRNLMGQTNIPPGLNGVTAISAGSAHGAALKQDGTVVTWGWAQAGTPPPGLAGVKSIACGGIHTLALLQNGTVVAWGENSYGQRTVPPGLSGVKSIAAGLYHSIAIKFDGTLVAWGSNTYGQSAVPLGLGDAKQVTAGDRHTLALVAKSSPVELGSVNRSAPLPRTFTIRNQGQGPLEIHDIEISGADAAFFAVGTSEMDELLETGESATFTVTLAAGRNGPHAANLRLVTNDTTRPNWDLALTGHGFNGSPVAPPVTGITTAEDTPVGITLPATDPEGDPLSFELTSLAPANAGTFSAVVNRAFTFTPKANFNGAVSFTYRASDGGTTSEGTVSLVVTPVNDPPVFSYLPDLIRVFTPDEAGAAVNFRMPVISDVEDGSITPVLTVNGQPVSNTSIFPTTTPSMVAKGTDSVGATVEGGILLSVVRTIGASARLENPDGAGLPRSPAVLEWNSLGLVSGTVPPDLRGVKQISAGDDHAIALRNDGTLFGWGAATQSRLSIPPDLTNVAKVVCGPNHTLALRSTGTVVAWGNNTYGQSTVPAGLSGITGIATGELFSLALRSNGTVTAWGQTFGSSWSPPANLTGVTAITMGRSHALALKSDGTVVAWGSNEYNKTTIPAGLSGVIAIAAGNDHSVALKSDGTVIVWGSTSYRQGPVPAGLTGVTSISAGPYHTMALKSDGSVVAWGSYQPNFRIQSLPPSVKNVTATDGGNGRLFAVADNPYSLAFGKVGTDRTVTRTVTIHNRGTAPLSIAGIARLSGSTSFTHSTVGMSSSVAAGGATTFSIAFAPSALGTETARFRVTSNDRYEATMDLEVSAEAVTPYAAWALAAGLTGGDATSDAEPFDDGLLNILKYAFNMDGSRSDRSILTPGSGTSGLPHISVEGSGDHSFLRVEYLRRRSGFVQYEVQTTTDLREGFEGVSIVPEVLPIDDDWERVIVRKPFDPAVEPIAFARVRVTF